jgi:hypothetical protein
MKREKLIAPIAYGAAIVVTGLLLVAFASSSVHAQQPPRPGCVAVSKHEYDSAKKKKLLRGSVGAYVRTGRVLRRHYYWFCR